VLYEKEQGRIQPVSFGGWRFHYCLVVKSLLQLRYCKRDEVYFTTLLSENNGRQNGLISLMLFSELYKVMANEVTVLS